MRQVEAKYSRSLREASMWFEGPSCSKDGSPLFKPGDAKTQSTEQTSRVKSHSNFSSITSTFSSDPERLQMMSGTLARPSWRRLTMNNEELADSGQIMAAKGSLAALAIVQKGKI
jgi:hypothetical protein